MSRRVLEGILDHIEKNAGCNDAIKTALKSARAVLQKPGTVPKGVDSKKSFTYKEITDFFDGEYKRIDRLEYQDVNIRELESLEDLVNDLFAYFDAMNDNLSCLREDCENALSEDDDSDYWDCDDEDDDEDWS